MKKTGKKSKLMVGLVVGVATMICGFVAYAATGIVKTDNKLDLKFVNFKSTVKNNQVSSTDWDELMDTLESLKAKVAALEAESDIPQGAVLAFKQTAGTTKGCPSGWTRWDDAADRVLKGTTALGAVGSNKGCGNKKSTIKLNKTQLPNHQHFLRYGGKSDYGDDANTRSVVVDWDTARVPWDPEDQNKRPGFTPVKIPAYSFYDVKTSPNGKGWGDGTYQDASGEEYTTEQKEIDISDPCIFVIYCIKD